MKPRTKFQKHVVGLQSRIKPITEKQKTWGFEYCFKPHGFYTKHKSGCLECGHSWKQDGKALLTILSEKCDCPSCGKTLKMKPSRSRVSGDAAYYSIITTFQGFQVVRQFHLGKSMKLGTMPVLTCEEVMQFWIDKNGKTCVFSILSNPFGWYGYPWISGSHLELRGKFSAYSYDRYNVIPYATYPGRRFIPELKRNGYTGKLYGLAPQAFFERLLADSKVETLIKSGQINFLKYYLSRSREKAHLWNSVKICIRNGYNISEPSIWADYIDLLIQRGKDVSNPHYACPSNLREAHDKLVRKSNEIRRRQATEKQRQDLEEAQVMYEKAKSKFFGIAFQDADLTVKVLETTEEIRDEGDIHKHCVFTNRYYQKEDSLLMSARVGDQSIETVEISLSRMTIVQCRGFKNDPTEHHDRIVSLINNNLNVIRKIHETHTERIAQ
jgi:hypothetical protein